MSKYVEKNLSDGEKVLCTAKHSLLCIVGNVIWAGILITAIILLSPVLSQAITFIPTDIISIILWAIFAFAGAIPLIARIFELLSEQLVVTQRRIFGKRGIFKVEAVDFPIARIDSIELHTSLLGAIFNYYTVIVRTSSNFVKPTVFIGIGNAYSFKNSLTEAIEQQADENRKKLASLISDKNLPHVPPTDPFAQPLL